MAKPQQQIPILQARSKSGGGAASLSQIAIAGFIDDQNKSQKKMMDNFTRLQEAQAASSAQGAAQMTGAMNQVVRREDERIAREESMQERQEDRQYAEKHQEFSAKFNEQAKKDFIATQTRVASQLASGRDFIQRMDADRIEFGDRIQGMRQSLNDPAYVEKLKVTPGGVEWLKSATNKLRVAEMYHERDHQSVYAGEVARMMSKVQEQINAGEDHTDLTKLLEVGVQDVLRGDLDLSSGTHDWTNDELEELYHSGGYPPGGLYGRDPEDPTLEKYRDFSPVEYMSTLQLFEDEEAFAIIQSDQGKQDWVAMMLESDKDKRVMLNKLSEFSTASYDALATNVVDRSFFAVAGFLDEMESGQISLSSLSENRVLKAGGFGAQDIQHTMAVTLLEDMFLSIAGPNSGQILEDLNHLLSGKGDKGLLDTEVELFKGFHMRNILRHLDDQVLAMSTAVIGDGKTAAAKFAKQIFEAESTPFKGEMIRGLTMVPGDVDRLNPDGTKGRRLEVTKFNKVTGALAPETEVQLEDGINRMFLLVKQMAMQLRDVIEGQPSLKSYHMRQGVSYRVVDARVASYMSLNPDADRIGVREDARSFARDLGEAADLSEREAGAPEGFNLDVARLKQAIKLSPLMAGVELWEEHTTHVDFLAALYSADYDLAPTDIPAVSAATMGEAQLGLDNYTTAAKNRRLAMAAEVMRKQGVYDTAHPELGDEPDTQDSPQDIPRLPPS